MEVDGEEEEAPKFSRVTECPIRRDLGGRDTCCDICQVPLILNSEDLYVCPECATVKNASYDNDGYTNHQQLQRQQQLQSYLPSNRVFEYSFDDGGGASLIQQKDYERLFYLNEKVSNCSNISKTN